jgi:hypothetical protein
MPSQWNQAAQKSTARRMTSKHRKELAASIRNMFAAARPKDKQ